MTSAQSSKIFMTGASGFLGKQLLQRYLQGPNVLYLLAENQFLPALQDFVSAYAGRDPACEVRYLVGDITQKDLGLSPEVLEELQACVQAVLHLAAYYHLAMPRELGMRVNVEGTKNVLDFCASLKALQGLAYLSTTAISGTHRGEFRESDFDLGQGFKNFYEETKFLAEKEVRASEVPHVIFRPTIIMGDSKTGEMQKIDGPYYGIRMILRKLHLILQSSPEVKCNVEPVDFVADAIQAILEKREALGQTLHLADPNPLSYDQFFDSVIQKLGTFKPLLRVRPELMRSFFKLPGFERMTGIPRQSFEYTMVPVTYGTEHASALLAGTGVACPPVSDYLDRILDYFKAHYRGL